MATLGKMIEFDPAAPYTPEQEKETLARVSRGRTALAAWVPFLGHLLLKLKPQVSLKIPTAGVTLGRDLLLNPNFIQTLGDAELIGLMAHEVLHPALLVWERQGPRTVMVTSGMGGFPTSLWNCFPAGTQITTEEGLKLIENIVAGDRVLTSQGIQSVVAPMQRQYEGKVFSVHGVGVEPMTMTDEHPVLAARRIGKTRPLRIGEPEWVNAKDLRVGDYLCVPRIEGTREDTVIDLDEFTGNDSGGIGDLAHRRILRKGLPLTEETAWLMGAYVAEGDTGGNTGLRWTIHENEAEYRSHMEAVIVSLGFTPGNTQIPERHAQRVGLSSPIVARAFGHYFGSGSHSKKIAPFILYHKNEKILQSFLAGYLQGDGHKEGRDRDVPGCGTASQVLAHQLQLIYARLGKLGKVTKRIQRDRKIRDTFVKGGKPIWMMVIHPGRASPRKMSWGVMQCVNTRWKVMDKYILTPIKKIEAKSFRGTVYNFETPCHDYVVSNCVVHNCAHDFAINLIIMDFAKNPDVGPNKLSLPPGGCLDDKYKNWSAEEVYDDLLEQVKQNGKSPQIRWGQGDCSCDDGQNGKNGESDGEEGENEGNSGGMSQSEAQRKENENFWKQSVVEASQVQEQAKGRGSLPGSIQKIVDELLNPKIYWLDLLSRWVGENGRRQDLSYRRPGRRSESVGEIMPSLVKYGVDDVCILWDTSGSMNGLEKEILPEVQGICDDLNLQPRLICIDTAIHSDTDDVSGAVEILEKGLIKGGGGSDYTPAFERLEEDHFEGVVIAFTDGDIGVPPSQPPNIKGVLWVIFRGNHSPTEKWGETIIVGEDGYVEKNRKA